MKAYFWWKIMEAKIQLHLSKEKKKKTVKSEFKSPQKCLSKT